MREAGNILGKVIFSHAGEADVSVEFGIEISFRHTFHQRQCTRLPGWLIVKSMENKATFLGDGQSIQTTKERFGLERAI